MYKSEKYKKLPLSLIFPPVHKTYLGGGFYFILFYFLLLLSLPAKLLQQEHTRTGINSMCSAATPWVQGIFLYIYFVNV